MIYLKSFFVAIGGAVGAAILWFIAAFAIPLFAPMLIGRFRNTGGLAVARITSDSLLIAAAIGFVVSFLLALRRLRAV